MSIYVHRLNNATIIRSIISHNGDTINLNIIAPHLSEKVT